MKKTEKFTGFLESLKDNSNVALIEAVKQAFVLTEASVRGMSMPDVKSPERKRLSNTGSKQLSSEEQATNAARFKREGSLARQAGGRASGSMAQIVKFAMSSPFDVEKWMNETLKPAIKQGKLDTDSKYGTDSAKVGFGQRIKNMGKAMLGEGTEVDYGDDWMDEAEHEENRNREYEAQFNKPDETDEDEIGGFKSNKDAKRLAKTRRSSLAEGAEVDYSDKDPFDDIVDEDEDEDKIGGFKSNKFEKRTANNRRTALNENSDKFIAFLESMKDSSNAKIIDSVKAAFSIIA